MAFELKTHRREKRRDELDSRVPDRKCPCCGETKLLSRSWVMLRHIQRNVKSNVRKVGAVCRSCYYKNEHLVSPPAPSEKDSENGGQ